MGKLKDMFKSKKKLDSRQVDSAVESQIKKFPKNMRKNLRFLHNEYKEGRLIIPADKDKEEVIAKLEEVN